MEGHYGSLTRNPSAISRGLGVGLPKFITFQAETFTIHWLSQILIFYLFSKILKNQGAKTFGQPKTFVAFTAQKKANFSCRLQRQKSKENPGGIPHL